MSTTRTRRLWIVAAVVVLLLATVAAVATASGSSAPQYRIAVATTADVQAGLDAVGAVQPLDRADESFPIAGTVATVPVTAGQRVSPGTVLATLDTTALDAQVASALSQLATAEAKLAADRDGTGQASAAAAPQAAAPRVATPTSAPARAAAPPPAAAPPAAAPPPAVPPVAAPPAAAPTTAPSTPVKPAPADPAVQAGVEKAAQAVTQTLAAREEHRKAAGAALAAAQSSLAAATTACGTSRSAEGDHPARTVASAHPAPGTCEEALQQALAGQAAVARLQDQVAADDASLATQVTSLVTVTLDAIRALTAPAVSPSASPTPAPATPPAAAPATTAPTTPPTSVPPTSVPPTSVPPTSVAPSRAVPTASVPAAAAPAAGAAQQQAGSAPAGSVATRAPASDEQIAADQAAVDAAQAQVTLAQQNRDQATLTSPIDGVVGAVNVEVGEQVGGGSTAHVVVIGSGRGYQAEVSISEADVARIAVGNAVTVSPDGGSTPIEGEVSSIALLPDSTVTGAVTYPVTIALPGATGPYPAGQGASVTIRLADVRGVLTVPTSAVHTDGNRHTVDLLRDGRAEPVPVQVGAVGPVRTQITSGLMPGEAVVLADPSRPLPTAGLSGLRGIGGGSGTSTAPRPGG